MIESRIKWLMVLVFIIQHINIDNHAYALSDDVKETSHVLKSDQSKDKNSTNLIKIKKESPNNNESLFHYLEDNNSLKGLVYNNNNIVNSSLVSSHKPDRIKDDFYHSNTIKNNKSVPMVNGEKLHILPLLNLLNGTTDDIIIANYKGESNHVTIERHGERNRHNHIFPHKFLTTIQPKEILQPSKAVADIFSGTEQLIINNESKSRQPRVAPEYDGSCRRLNSSEKTIDIAVLVPTTESPQYQMKRVMPAVELGVNHLRKTGLRGPLEGWKVSVLHRDTHCSSTHGPLAAVDLHFNQTAGEY